MTETLHILLLEDNPVDAEIIRRLLVKELGQVELMQVADKPQYLAALDRYEFNIILSDNGLPQFNATEALQIIRDRSMHIPFILITGTVSEEFAAGIIKKGADDYILKDRMARLPAAIDAALKQRRYERERQESIEKLIKGEEKYRTLIERVSDGFIALDKDWKYTYANKKIGEMIRRDPETLLGKNIWEMFPDVVGSATYKAFHKAMEEQVFVKEVDYYEPFDLWQESNIYPSPDGLSVFISDITERKKAHDLLQKSYEDIRELASHLQDIREEERAAMSREIHDELGQQLTGFKMDIFWLNRKLQHADEEVRQKIESTLSLIDSAIKTVRRIATDLRPSILDDLGFITAMEWQSEEFEKRSGIKVQFEHELKDIIVEPKTAIALFRMYQELLTNVARHAKATLVKAVVYLKEDILYLSLVDNGVGFDVKNISTKKTLGLLGIKERTLLLGGKYEIKSKENCGTDVLISIPFDNITPKA